MRTSTRRKMLKTASRGQLTGWGETVSEAKADLTKRVDQALEGSYDPFLVVFGEYTILAWREPENWCYKIMRGSDIKDGIHQIGMGCCGGSESRDEFLQQAAYHVINVSSVDYHKDEEIPEFLTDRSKRQDILHCCRFQRAYRYAKENVPEGRDNDSKWHEWACWNARDPMFD
jgi:hypothetical protein